MNKTKFIFGIALLLGLILITSVYAIELGISPAKMELNSAKINERVCQNVNVFSSTESYVLIVDRWNEKGESKDINDYTKDAVNLGLATDYPKSGRVDGKETISFCASGTKPGTYYGVLLIRSSGSAGVGMWVKLVIGDGKNDDSETVSITGKTTQNSNSDEDSKYLLPLTFSTFLLFILLIFLLYFSRKKGKKDNSENKESEHKKLKDEDDWEED